MRNRKRFMELRRGRVAWASQGEEPEHDQIRAKEVAEGAPEAIAAALHRFASNEEVLWAALFSLAVLVRDGNPHPQAARAIVGAGMLPLLRSAMATYQVGGMGARGDVQRYRKKGEKTRKS
jgi:hypothetical protein